MNADPAAVAFETTRFAMENNCDIAIIDTAGRLHNKSHLMQVTRKRFTAQSEDPPVARTMYAGNRSTGQNAQEQARHFTEVAPITCLALIV
jgi:fused signal recognition particle receptor